MRLQSSSLSNQDISTALLVGIYTALVEISDLSVQVALDEIAGDGNYQIYTTRQLGGAGAQYPSPVITEAVADGDTSHVFAPVSMSANATDVINVYVVGLPADDATIDVVCEFWGLAEATVAGGSSSPLYASLAEYKAWFSTRGLGGATGTDASDDTAIEAILEAASRYVDRQTGRRFYQNAVDETRYYTSEDQNRVEVDDLASITTVSGDYSGMRSYTEIPDTDYDALPDNAALDGKPYNRIEINPMSGTYFPTTRKGIQIIGIFGWPAVPADIKDAVLMIAQSLNSTRSGQTASGKLTVTAAGIVIRPEDVPPFAQAVILHYRDVT